MSDDEIELEDNGLAAAAGGYTNPSEGGFDPTTNSVIYPPLPTPPLWEILLRQLSLLCIATLLLHRRNQNKA